MKMKMKMVESRAAEPEMVTAILGGGGVICMIYWKREANEFLLVVCADEFLGTARH